MPSYTSGRAAKNTFHFLSSYQLAITPFGEICSLLLTYLLTPWTRVLLEKLTVNFAASQEIPRIYGTRKFLTVPTSARHLSSLLLTVSLNES
jgi:hypothetical protein